MKTKQEIKDALDKCIKTIDTNFNIKARKFL